MKGALADTQEPLGVLYEIDFGNEGKYISATHVARLDSMQELVSRGCT